MKICLCITLLLLCLQTPVLWAQTADGEIQSQVDGSVLAWHQASQQWLTIEGFWQAYSKQKGEAHWAGSSTYPNYDDVEEFDTFLVQVAEGPCLMEFFHSRWRRANDVKRWAPAFNDYGGCPFVFK